MAVVYTCFGLENVLPYQMHMTHKYLGDQSQDNIDKILEIVEAYFKTFAVSMPEIAFGRLDFLGPKYVPAMCISDTAMKRHLLLDLRKELDRFYIDDFEYWTPHVSKRETPFSIKFNRFYVVVGNQMVLGIKLETR